MKHLFMCALLIIPALALAADSNPDSSFYKALAEGGIAEVEAGQLAQNKSSNDQVKQFAATMVKDHSAANDELKTLAASKNITLPDHSSVMQKAAHAKLDILSGETFDKAYVRNQIKAHRQTVSLLNKEIGTGQDADAKAFAQKILPTVRSHLKMAYGLADSLGVKH
jgi:putative membrane protein